MGWSVTILRVAGISVRLHVTFLLFLVWIAASYYIAGGALAAVRGVALIGAIFGSVLLHEFGHALAARRFGVRTPDITLLPIGGVARLERLPEKPRQELWVALAGPAVNVAILALLYAYLAGTQQLAVLSRAGLLTGSAAGRLFFVNLWLLLFNLIPAFPMDGGRVLRALLAERLSYARATEIAAATGQGIAFLFALVGFFFNPFLIFIALFVYLGASSEVPVAQMREAARGLPVAAGMITQFRALSTEAPLSEAVEALLRGYQKEFPVVDPEGRVQGMLCREEMIQALNTAGAHAPIAEVMRRDVPAAAPQEMLEKAFHKMAAGNHAAIPVLSGDGSLVGLLTRENLAEMMMVHRAGPSPRPEPVFSPN